MRGAIGRRFSNPNNGFSLASIVKRSPFLIQPSSHFSSDGAAGRGRGRGGSGFPAAGNGQFGINREPEKVNEPESQSAGGYGHGRGRPIQSDPISPPFSSFVKPNSHSVGRGRGSVGSDPVSPFSAQPPRHPAPPQPHQPRFEPQHPRFQPQQPRFEPQQPRYEPQQPRYEPQQPRYEPQQQRYEPQQQRYEPQQQRYEPQQPRYEPQQPRFEQQQQPRYEQQQQQRSEPQQPRFEQVKDEFQGTKDATLPPQPPPESKPGQTAPPNNISNALGSGAGRGTPFVRSAPPQNEQSRHIQRPQPPPQQRQKRVQPPKDEAPRPQLSPEEAGRRARSQLSRGEAEGGGGGGGVRGRGGGRGRGRGARGRGRGRGGGEGWRDDKKEEEAEQEALSVFVGDSTDGEKFAKKMGAEIMNQLAEGYEDICERALPSTAHDALVDAYDTNLMIECEPEYLMADFGSNPDIDEKPPMPLRECLEKVKPFIVAYEGIKDQEEWEEAIGEVMKEAPLIKDIVDHYSGPDRVTAKKQNEELDRIATTLPQSAPDSVKRFADRAALSLKSNPGWGFDKKYQFMDKLVLEVSQSYK